MLVPGDNAAYKRIDCLDIDEGENNYHQTFNFSLVNSCYSDII